VEPEALAYLAHHAMRDCSFLLREKHLKQVAAILDDPLASENDRYVALTLLRNAEISAEGVLPFCQDTGTATVVAKKGQQVWTGANDAEYLSRASTRPIPRKPPLLADGAPGHVSGNQLRHQPAAQIDLYATEGARYDFLFVAKGGGSANKTFLYQETKALLNPEEPGGLHRRQDEASRNRRVPPVSSGHCDGGTSAKPA